MAEQNYKKQKRKALTIVTNHEKVYSEVKYRPSTFGIWIYKEEGLKIFVPWQNVRYIVEVTRKTRKG